MFAGLGSGTIRDLTQDTIYTHPIDKVCNYTYTHPSSRQCSFANDYIPLSQSYNINCTASTTSRDVSIITSSISGQIDSSSFNDMMYVAWQITGTVTCRCENNVYDRNTFTCRYDIARSGTAADSSFTLSDSTIITCSSYNVNETFTVTSLIFYGFYYSDVIYSIPESTSGTVSAFSYLAAYTTSYGYIRSFNLTFSNVSSSYVIYTNNISIFLGHSYNRY